MKEEAGEGAYAGDVDDADGFISGARRTFLVLPPPLPSSVSDDRLVRLGAFRLTPGYSRQILTDGIR